MFKKLKSLFIIEDEDTGKQTQVQNGPTTVEPQTNTPSNIKIEKPVFDKDNPPKGKVDEKFINRLLGAIEEANLEGFDYLEYKQALQNLAKMEMDEATKFKSTLAMAQTMGASAASLKDSAGHYIKILKEEENKFLEAFRKQIQRHNEDHTNQIKSLELSISNKKKQIEQLSKEVENEAKQLEDKISTVEKSKAKVNATKDSFYHAYHIVAQQIQDDLEKMNQYLK
ncbi:MAG: hypothetical protein HKN09_04235 [Saprospiraceae bacterium]|nr:hypothetical protein [Saprospiraceae bacterium]